MNQQDNGTSNTTDNNKYQYNYAIYPDNYIMTPSPLSPEMERPISPMSVPMVASDSLQKNVQFTEASPLIHKYDSRDMESAIYSSDEEANNFVVDHNDNAITNTNDLESSNKEANPNNSSLIKDKLNDYKFNRSSFEDNKHDNGGVFPVPEEFNKRPLSDTPIISENTSPAGFSALSPLVLSEDEEEDEDDDDNEGDENENKSDTNNVKKNKEAKRKKRLLEEVTRSNTKQNKAIPPSIELKERLIVSSKPIFRTTLDIPGQTKSKLSPDGSIVSTNERVVVVMIGLPARGKSYLSNKLVRYLNWLQINARIFNVGSMRRAKAAHMGPENSPLPDQETETTTTHDASFFSPDNKQNILMREQWAKETLENLLDYLLKGDGCVGVFDATNSTKARRKMVLDTIMEKSQGQLKVLFLESICNDESIIENNVHLKLQGPDYKNMDPDLAIKDFVGRLHNYEKAYETIDEEEEKNKNFQYVKMIDVGRKVIACNIKGFLASQIIYYFLNFNLSSRQIFIARHGESVDNVSGKIGGDSVLTERGHRFSKALARFMLFKKEEFRKSQLEEFAQKAHYNELDSAKTPPEEPSFSVFTSMMKRSVQTAEHFREDKFDVKEMRMLDELGSGKFDGMTYQEIQEGFPEEFKARLENKMSYRYPGVGGESYLDVINRLKPVITEIERTTNHLLLITHRVVSRVLLAYFLNLSKDSVGDLDVPLHTVYLFEPKPFGVDWHMYEYDEAKDWFYEINPETLENSKMVKQVGITFRERKYSVVPTAPRRPSSLIGMGSSAGNIRRSILGSLPHHQHQHQLQTQPGLSSTSTPSSSSSSSSALSSITNPSGNNHSNVIPRFSYRANTNVVDNLQKARGIMHTANHLTLNVKPKHRSADADNIQDLDQKLAKLSSERK